MSASGRARTGAARAAALAAAVVSVWAFAPPARADDALPPPPARHVLDEADWLTADEESRLDSMLADYEAKTSNQFVVAIFRTLGDEDLGDRSQRIAQHWRLGQAGKDNGVLLAVFADDRLMSLEVGYGLEPVITDLVATRVRRDILEPAFREGRYYDGIRRGMQALADAAAGEFRAPRRSGGGADLDWGVILALVVVVLVVAWIVRRERTSPVVLDPKGVRRAKRVRRSWGGGDWGGFGGFGGGGGGGFGGGGGGGGFRGGGGSFGGGGSRGSW